MNDLFTTANGDARAAAEAFETILAHPALTTETKDELRYQWDLVLRSG